jgi:hypothetical protein
MSKYDNLWQDYWCLDVKSYKKNQIYKDTYSNLINSNGSDSDLNNEEYIIERNYPKIQHLRFFFKKEESNYKKLKENFSSRKWLMKHYGIKAHHPYTAKAIDKIPNVFKISFFPAWGGGPKIDENIDGKNKIIKKDYFHIKLIGKNFKNYKRTFKKVENISKDKELMQFKGIKFSSSSNPDAMPGNYSWIILPGAKLSEYNFYQEYGNEFKVLSEDYRKEFKKFGSGLKSELKKKLGSFNPFRKKDDK